MNKSHYGFGISHKESKAFFKEYQTDLRPDFTPGPGQYADNISTSPGGTRWSKNKREI